MAESSQQPATQTNNTLPSFTHIQRLEHRRTEPSGIVDVRPFQSRFTRVPDWIVQRSAVLDGILKRYSSQNNTSAQEAELVLVAPSQAVPGDETSTFETATQTTTPSTVPIARASRADLTIHRSSTPTKPSVTPSIPQQLPQQRESQRQSPLTVKNSPAALTLQRTASPSPSSSSSPPPPSGQFRVSRKGIPLPKLQANTPANSTLVSAKKDLGEGKSEDEDEASTIIYSSIDASNHPPAAEEITPISHQSQNFEPSLILPKRLQQESSPTSGSAQHTLQGTVGHSTIQRNSSQQNIAQIPKDNTQYRPNTIEKEIRNHQSQQFTKSLILPKRLSQSSTDTSEISSSSSQLEIENASSNQNSIKPDVSQPTINQPVLAREIATQPEPSLILPKRLQQESSPTSGSAQITLQGKVAHSTIQRNSSQHIAQIPKDNTQYRQNTSEEEIRNHQPQQFTKSLILPKRLSQSSTDNLENSSSSSQLEIENASSNQHSIKSDISQLTINQPVLAREIATQPEISQASTPSLILPKRLQQESSPTSGSAQHTLQGTVGHSTIQRNSSQQNMAQIPTDVSQPTRNQPTIAREIAQQVDISQIPTQSLILPKRFQQETSQTSGNVHVTLQDGRERLSRQENSTQQNIAKVFPNNAQNQLPIVGKIASTLHELPQQEPSLILPKRLSEPSARNAESFERSRNLPTRSTLQQTVGRESSLKTSVVTIARSAEPLRAIAQGAVAKPIASEIPSTQNSLEQQNMVWRKSVSTASSENLLSHVSDRNHKAEMPLPINSVRGEPYIAHQISTTSSPNSIATAEMNNPRHTTRGTPAQTNTQAHEINVAQIAEQVSRILHRNLSIERERRGMNLWY